MPDLPDLPVAAALPQLCTALNQHNRAILQAPPGAGKSTQVPLALLDADWVAGRKLLLLEPRRLAAGSLARFMAAQLGEAVGERVGYCTRLESRVGPSTRIEVVTEGILTRRLQADPLLEAYAAIIFDEVHERSLQADTALALVLDIQESLREDLRLLLMSATLSGSSLQRLLGEAPLIQSEGRAFPVTCQYRPVRPQEPLLPQVAKAIRTVLTQQPGSVLVFLPGVGEIRRLAELLEDLNGSTFGGQGSIQLCPLYGDLSAQAQRQAIAPPADGQRKVVLATSIAETSLTIEGIGAVVDSGLSRVPRFDLGSGLTRLETVPVSRAAAEQRAGRAGRLGPGVCVRLWSEEQHVRRVEAEAPEIASADLCGLVLELAAWGVSDPGLLKWQDLPPATHWQAASALLQELEALDAQGRISAHGRRLLALGIHPRLAHMLCRSDEEEQAGRLAPGTSWLACHIAAVLEERDLLGAEGRDQADLGLRLQLLERGAGRGQREALRRVRQQAERLFRRLGSRHRTETLVGGEAAGGLLAWAYPDRIALQRSAGDTRYLLSNGRGAMLALEDPLCRSDCLAVATVREGRSRADARIELAAPLSLAQVEKHFAGQIRQETEIGWDARRRAPLAEERRCLGRLVLSRRPLSELTAEQRSRSYLAGIRCEGLEVLPWTAGLRAWRQRVICARLWMPEAGWPDLSDVALLDSLEGWLGPYLQDLRRWDQLRQLDLAGPLKSLLSWQEQQRLEQLLPSHYLAPTGSRIPIDYDSEQPRVSVRLQEMFGETRTPTLADGRKALVIELLSPARRPVQVTQDLEAFWNGSYQEVRREMKGRYPKHAWPEDPWQAHPTRGTKRRP